ncbi:MAG: permease [Acidobacteriota bacterium]|nr:permease [Acidobacteriota bacterium]
MTIVGAYWISVWQVLLELAPWLLFGTAVAGALHVLLPPDFVARHLRGRGGVAKAVILGVPMPLCSCGVIPAGLGLKRDGASDGAAIGFLVSTPQTGVDSIFVSASFLGLPFALFKLGSAAVTGLIAGWLTDGLGRTGEPVAETDPTAASEARGGLVGGWRHAVEILRSIWKWLVFGVLVSAAISAFVPDEALVGLSRYGTVGAALAALVLSLPLYVCATASVPIAAALVGAGMPAGAALVFLMAGPASNVATIGAIFRGFGARVLAIYLGTIGVGSVLSAVVFDGVIGSTEVARDGGHEMVTWWAQASAIALVGLLGLFAFEDLRRLWVRPPSGASDLLELGVEGMTCKNCVAHVESALAATDGVTAVAVDLESGRASVQGTADPALLRAAIRKAGYQPV